MINDLFREMVSWLGYLQRGLVLIQIACFLGFLIYEPSIQRQFKSNVPQGLINLIAPVTLFLSSLLAMAASFPGGFLRYLSGIWLIWRLLEPIKSLTSKRFPEFPFEELESSILRPIFLLVVVLSFFQIIGSRESLSVIQLGTIFGVVITIGKLFSAIVITYAIFTFASRPASLLAWISAQFFGIKPQSRKALELILRYTVVGLGIVSVAYYLGINGTALVAVAGGLSVGIGFGLKEIISNFISSLWMLFEGTGASRRNSDDQR